MAYQRMIDELGRLVLPAEYLKAMGAIPEQSFHITLEDGRLVLTLAN